MPSKQWARVVLLFVLAVILTLAVIGRYFGYFDAKPSQQALIELGFFQFDEPRALTPIDLMDLQGVSATLTNRHNHWQLVNFGYMFCPDICPVNLRFINQLTTAWAEVNADTVIKMVHITFDPQRDTPEKLRQYLDYYNPEYTGLSGSLDNIRQLAQQLSVLFIHEEPDEYGNYFISHSDSIALLNPAGEYVGMFKGPYDIDKAMAVLKQVVK